MPTVDSRPDLFSKLERQSPKKQKESVIDQFRSEPVSPSAKNVEPGDHLVFPRKFYDHHGICTEKDGENVKVVEYTGPGFTFWGSNASRATSCFDSGAFGVVKETSYTYEELEKGKVKKKIWPDSLVRYSRSEIISRAKKRLGETFYGLLENNCEHFASWCICGLNVSLQVKEWFYWFREAFYSVCASLKQYVLAPTALKNCKSEIVKFVAKVIANFSDELSSKLESMLVKATDYGFLIGIIIEGLLAIYEVIKAQKKWKEGVYTDEEWYEKVVEVLAKGTCRLAGGIIGSVYCQQYFGSLIGGAIGAGLGHIIGFCISWYYKNSHYIDG
ncbi:uncharacterized protein LOC110235241 [Exaiptasia diaphana]|uniref:LRAT domain-containing protein n=1 Tax=Exaiptasia diaphana TaxID=2652724 RepID=A0A913WZH8_EXADI|nr:uncharacterized protein LOC110235241 [Exaiptasia diaphana]